VITKHLFGTYHYRLSESDSSFGVFASRRSAYAEHLRREKARAERSATQLSTAVLSFKRDHHQKLIHTRMFCRELQQQLRETDSAYVIDRWTIGLILPHTDEQGVERLVCKLERFHARHGVSVKSETFDRAHTEWTPPSYEALHRDVAAAVYEASQKPETAATAEFARQIRLEKRRTDRSKSPFSILLLSHASGRNDFEPLIEAGRRLMKQCVEIDGVGRMGSDTVGIILPHTDREAAEEIKRRLELQTGDLPLTVRVTTYPDQVLDRHRAATYAPEAGLDCPLVGAAAMETSRAKAVAKRAVDIFGSLVGLAIFSPVMLVTAVAVKMSSPGPIIFKQTRVGEKGVPFAFYKFRSMRTNADDRIHREYVASLIQGKHEQIDQGGDSKPLYKIKADPRVTAVGRIIRKTSLDELPQFFNVLKGDMSLVGPRPPLPYEVEQYQSWHLRRVLDVKPGITGLWQVEGRSRTSFDDMVRLDLRYSSKWSLVMDFSIMLRTFKSVVQSSGAC